VRFHDKFFDVDWPILPPEAQEALSDFLIRLQNNPTDTEIYKGAQEKHGRYAYPFFRGWVVYWRLDIDEDRASVFHDGVRYIYVLAVEPEQKA
jgi:hypothetical protein